MRTASGRSSRALVAAITALLTTVGGTVALADQFVTDGDTLTSGPNVSVSACGVAHSFSGTATVSFQGGGGTSHFANGAVVTVTATPSVEAVAAGITATGGTLTLPTPWTNASPNALDLDLALGSGRHRHGYVQGRHDRQRQPGRRRRLVDLRLVQRERELPGEHAPDRERPGHR